MTTACVILADGFEEIEAMSVIDILRRGQVHVTVAGMDKHPVTSAHQVTVSCDTTLEKEQDNLFDAIILPGGEPGTTHLEANPQVAAAIMRHAENGKIVGAICAAPRILNSLGLLQGKAATSYPGTRPQMTRCQYKEENVVVDGLFITSRGPGTAMDFGYALLTALGHATAARQLREGMLHNSVLAYGKQ